MERILVVMPRYILYVVDDKPYIYYDDSIQCSYATFDDIQLRKGETLEGEAVVILYEDSYRYICIYNTRMCIFKKKYIVNIDVDNTVFYPMIMNLSIHESLLGIKNGYIYTTHGINRINLNIEHCPNGFNVKSAIVDIIDPVTFAKSPRYIKTLFETDDYYYAYIGMGHKIEKLSKEFYYETFEKDNLNFIEKL